MMQPTGTSPADRAPRASSSAKSMNEGAAITTVTPGLSRPSASFMPHGYKGMNARHKSAAPAMADLTQGTPGERIAKVMARAGLCSRREAEAWIAAGRVSVNGQAIASPALNVSPADRIEVDGQPLPRAERTRLFLFHKPRGLVTTNADPQGRPTIFDALPKGLPRLVTVGRLDLNTEGLLLLTNDGGLARVLEHPNTGWLRRYRVRAHGKVTQAALDALRPGVTVDGVRYGPIEATLDREQGANIWLTFAIREGKNREVRNVLDHLGLSVNRLIRISFGPFQLGELKPNEIEEVRTRHLREQLGERIATEAGVDFAGPMSLHPARPERPAKPEREPKNGTTVRTGKRRKSPEKELKRSSPPRGFRGKRKFNPRNRRS
jgi:23S rRNA pseudouridine2605 synthase